MKILTLDIENIRCFEKVSIQLSETINVLIGANNSGKSTIMNCISCIQDPNSLIGSLRIKSADGLVRITFSGDSSPYIGSTVDEIIIPALDGNLRGFYNGNNVSNAFKFRNNEPINYIVPYLSRRKVGEYSHQITAPHTNQVSGTLSNLFAKIDKVSNPEFLPAYNDYIKACDEIIGFRISTSSSGQGKQGVYIIRNDEQIAIESMGEGIPNILGLIVDLCRAENKLFIIEEIENDIHPKALKKLLELIIAKSTQNQFIISTHSNIVVKYLGAECDTAIFHTEMAFFEKIPLSSITHIKTEESRRIALEDLGYDLFDYGLWNYWLFLEESSAERIIRDYLIPWFLPHIDKKVRTFATNGIDSTEIKFDEFNRLFVYLHLEATYKNKAWVLVDYGDHETKILNQIIEKWSKNGWDSNHFKQLANHDFETYYPIEFNERVSNALAITDKRKKKSAKEALLIDVLNWIKKDETNAKIQFETSAKDVIDILNAWFPNA